MSTTSSPVPSDPASTTGHSTFRPSRRRGLSYLRNYTHHRLSSFAGQNTEPLSTSPSLQPETLQRVVSSPTQPTTSDGHLVTPADSPRLSTTENHGNSVYPITEQRPPSTEPPATSTVNTVNSALGGISRLMARHRAGSAPQGKDRRTTSEPGSSSIAFGPGPVAGAGPGAGAGLTGYPLDQMPTIRLIPHQDPRSARPSLTFPPMSRTLPHEDCVIRVGRYSERDTNPNPPPNVPSSAPVGFKSKVVSRRHCEFWCSNGQWYIKDVKSSSGTFLNHIRLSQPSVESRPWPLNDGDVVQLGIDFRGGEEMIFRCVKIRVECNRGWQKSLNNFNVTTHKRILGKPSPKKDTDTASSHSSECSICLMSIAPCQSLFVAPCSHVWHYKCIRPILNDHKTWPQFLCPNCRAVADLEADVEDPDAFDDWEDEEAEGEVATDSHDVPMSDGVDPAAAAEQSVTEDNALTTMTSQRLSIGNEVDPPLESTEDSEDDPQPPSLSPDSVSSDPPLVPNSGTSLLIRRNANRVTPPRHQPLPPTTEESPAANANFTNYLRPITPTQPLMDLGDSSMRAPVPGEALTPNTSEMLNSDGPMTPTNNAGPFVFDGSAGRAAGRRVATTLSEGSDGAQPNAW